ncbi:MAG: hypothetical protein GX325_04585 [Peptococcaceae bacterium]|nr:hypothetical protein [Peptococcaceae bacterium]
MGFICDTCGKEVSPKEGTLSWVDEGNSLRDFKITHEADQNHQCHPRHVGYVHLWIATGIIGYTKLTEMLADYWVKGYNLDDITGLKKALNQISLYMWEKSKK